MWNQMRNLYQYFQIFSTVNVLIRKEKKHSHSTQREKKSWESGTLFYNRLFNKVLWNCFFFKNFFKLIRNAIFVFWYQGYQNGKFEMTNSYNRFHNISDFLTFHQIFLSPQVKRCLIITYKHDIYELPHDLPSNLRLRILGNYEIWRKCLSSTKW